MSSPVEGARPTVRRCHPNVEGREAGTIKVPPIAFSALIRWRRLRRWNIGETLACGSEVLISGANRLRRYSWQITAISAAFLLQAE